MSTYPKPTRRRWTPDPKLARGGALAEATSLDKSQRIASKPARLPVSNDNPALWRSLNVIRDPNTGATKTTRVMACPGGMVINTCTRTAKGAVAEALVFVPGAAPGDWPAGR